jgi:hypothetical protein
METGFGARFAGVRIHTGADAVDMNRRLRAHAFTHGKDIFFNAGKYEPDSTRGRRLLAHELTHVVQQGAAKQQATPPGPPAPPRETTPEPPREPPRETTRAAPREPRREAPRETQPREAPPRETPRETPREAPREARREVPIGRVERPGAAPQPAPPSRGAPAATGSAARPPLRAEPVPVPRTTERTTATPAAVAVSTLAAPRVAPTERPPVRETAKPNAPASATASARGAAAAETRPSEAAPSEAPAPVGAAAEGPSAPAAVAEGGAGAAPAAEAEAPAEGASAAEAGAREAPSARGALAGAGAETATEPRERGEGVKRGKVGEFLRRSTAAKFGSKQAGIKRRAVAEKRKKPAEAKVEQAEKAVVPPSKEGEAKAGATQVAAVDRAPAPQVDERAPKQKLATTLEKAVPASLKDMDSFKEEGKGRAVGAAVQEVVSADTQEVESTYDDVEGPVQAEPPESEPEKLPEVEAAPPAPAVDPGEGVVGQVQPEHAHMSEFDKQSDDAVKKEGITDEQLDMVDEGDLAEANAERKKIKGMVKDAPAAIKETEAAEKQKVSQELAKEEQDTHRQMREERKTQLTGTRNDQKKAKTAIEKKREAVTLHMTSIYEQAKASVKLKLEELEKKSLADFDTGQAQATRAFEDNVKRRMSAFKARRYDRIGGGFLWAKDKLLGMDDLPEVKEIFVTERTAFVSAMDGLVARITAENKRVVAECRQIVADARQKIEKFVQGLGPEVRSAGKEALKDIRDKLAAMDQQIDEKEKALQAKLAEKREAAIKAIDQKIEKMKEELSGGLAKLGNLILNALLKFFEWALKKAGYSPDQLMGIINKGKAVIKKIVSDPIGFLKNVIQAVKGGIDLFQANIKKHLTSGLMGWLTGAMADVPIQLPDTWDLKGILHLVLQILGLTWQNIRTKLVKRLGEKVVSIAEKSVDILKRLITEGPIALWEMLKEKAAEIKEQVMEGIRNWAIVELVKQGIIKLVSFLNPVGAIVQAILAIYNTVMFFIENWQRIVQFVQTVFNSIGDIAMGRISAAAKLVESAMAMTIPIILSFLARLLGLSGIGKTVSGIIKKIRKPIDKIVNKVVATVVKLAKKLVKKVKAGGKALKEKGLALIKWWKEKRKFKTEAGESHTLLFKRKNKTPKLMVSSDEKTIPEFVSELNVPKAKAPVKSEALTLANEIQTITRGKDDKKGVQTKEATAITTKMTSLCAKLAMLTEGGEPILPKRTPPVAKTDPKGTHIENLSVKSVTAGTKPKGTDPEFTLLRARRVTKAGDKWVRMHLLSQALGGPGAEANWVPAPNSVNTGAQVTSFESSLKRLVERSASKKANVARKFNVVWATAQVSARHPAGPATGDLENFPKIVTFKAGLQYPKNRTEWPVDKTERVLEKVEIEVPPMGVVQSLSRRLSHTMLSSLNPIFTRTNVAKMRDAQRKHHFRFTKEKLLDQLRSVHRDDTDWQGKTEKIHNAILELLPDKLKMQD